MEALVERLGHGASLRELTLHRTQAPDGTISERWQIDNDEDLRLFRKSQTWANAAEVAAIGALDPGHTVQPKASAAGGRGHCFVEGARGLVGNHQESHPPQDLYDQDGGC